MRDHLIERFLEKLEEDDEKLGREIFEEVVQYMYDKGESTTFLPSIFNRAGFEEKYADEKDLNAVMNFVEDLIRMEQDK